MSERTEHSPAGTPRRSPFLKWPGGKRWLTPFLVALLKGQRPNKYFEPFLGGGALFFALRPHRAYLSDINADLINAYVQVRDNHEKLIACLKDIPVTEEIYYTVRARRRHSSLTRAVDFLYLNRTAFGGIYRLNSRGEFNVPYGGGARTPHVLYNTDILANAAALLKHARLTACDFEVAMSHAGRGDVVYCDPTYTVAHDNNGFVRYNERNFSWADQCRLADAARAAARAGATVIISNAHHDDLAALYIDASCHVVTRRSLLAKLPDHRRVVSEYIFVYTPT